MSDTTATPTTEVTEPATPEAVDTPTNATEEHENGSDGNTDGAGPAISEEEVKAAEEAKELGNKAFKAKRFAEAIEHYTEAICHNPTVPAYYTNRAFAYIKTEGFGAAREDANAALKLSPRFVKAYYRRASANMGLGLWKKSRKDFEIVLKVKPNDKDAKGKHKEVDKIIKRIAFEKAISVGENEKGFIKEMTELMEKTSVPDSYDGPRLDGNCVTKEFVEALLPYLKDQKKLHDKYVLKLLLLAFDFFKKLPSLIDVAIEDEGKLTVCGDVHGQFYDVLNIFEINGMPSEDNPYLFNGDFVDRGSFSVEVILSFLSLKLLYPNHFYMSRGNHETINMNQMYGFTGEVKAKYDSRVGELFTEVYNWLPLGHLIQNKILVVHGGLFSEDGVKVDQLRKIQRNKQPPQKGLMCEMLWSDPGPLPGRHPSQRGIGVLFGEDVTKAFLEDNDLSLLIRSHEMKMGGYEIMHSGKCITVFSAPNYCDSMGNKGAFITLDKTLEPKFTTFEAVPHPPVKPMAYAGGMFSQFGF